MMTRIDVKKMHSRELRELRKMIREELDFRANVGTEIERRDLEKKEWLSATKWSDRIEKYSEVEERERLARYIDESVTPIWKNQCKDFKGAAG